MNKNLLSLIALVLAAVALVFACISVGRLNARLEELKDANEALTARLQELSGQVDSFFIKPTVTGVSQWDLAAEAWSDGSGADVTLTMVPMEYNENISVRFTVTLGGQPMADVPCVWDGTAYTATAGLPAMNGYTYSCVFESASGNDTQILASPDAPTVSEAVYLADSLSSYCNLLVDSWTLKNGSLFISGHAQIQLPQIGGDSAEPEASLYLILNGEELQRCGIELVPGEGSGSFEAELSNFDFNPLPALQEGETLALYLDVVIGTGTESVCGGEWYLENGELLLVAG